MNTMSLHPVTALRPSSAVVNVRLTHRCNANCTYCSCETSRGDVLSLDTFKSALKTIAAFWDDKGIRPSAVEANFIGGEVLTLPRADLTEIVRYCREFFTFMGIGYRDGVQTNLIGSVARVHHLQSLFQDRIGSSIDSFSNKRTVNGSADSYRSILERGRRTLASHGHHTSLICTIDADNAHHVLDEAVLAMRGNYGLTIRPVFPSQYGSVPSRVVPVDVLRDQFLKILDAWMLKSSVILMPFHELLLRRMTELGFETGNGLNEFGCHHRTDCAFSSLHIEPNGQIYQCSELCDQGHGRLFDGPSAPLNNDVWHSLAQRTSSIERQCGSCEYRRSCQGGCMSDSIAHGKDLMSRSPYCEVWVALFSYIDEKLEKHGGQCVLDWMATLDDKSLHAQQA